MKNNSGYLMAGVFFGFALSRSGASDYNFIHYMFSGHDLRLAFLMITAIVTGAVGMQLLKRLGNKDAHGNNIEINRKPLNKNTVIGGLIFGTGWAVTGACPGTVLAQIGEGKALGLFTAAGMVFGTYLYARFVEEPMQNANKKD